MCDLFALTDDYPTIVGGLYGFLEQKGRINDDTLTMLVHEQANLSDWRNFHRSAITNAMIAVIFEKVESYFGEVEGLYCDFYVNCLDSHFSIDLVDCFDDYPETVQNDLDELLAMDITINDMVVF
ncbi:hypothetical protein LP092_14985 (plasmid) [Moraxella bovis]|uniref:Uncharacterized protein n=1 Tax=Moraxella bovis TaxID=476 RepID=A0ABY6MB18_MORBO|nr:hypothetical protein [Moraxella bovis]UZA04781.1 hypothetical protein LP092_14985 [Moraxella bovis]